MALSAKCALHSLSYVSGGMHRQKDRLCLTKSNPPSLLQGRKNDFPLQCTRNQTPQAGKLSGGILLQRRLPMHVEKLVPSDRRGLPKRIVAAGASTETPPTGEDVRDPFSSPEGTCDPLCSVDDMSTADFVETYKPREDLFKALVIGTTVSLGALAINHSWVVENQTLALWSVFVLGYAGIIFEESLAFNKSGVGLLMAVTLWTIRSIAAPSPEVAVMELKEQATDVSEIVYFLLGAMTIVEIVDAHQGFKLVTDSITTRSPRLLLWVVGIITFFLSSILDNLTSTIVMVSLLRKLVSDPEQRKFLGAVVVIAANAGGAWTPIGDVTTTMLWINGQISTVKTITDLFLPSAVSLAVPLALMSISTPTNDTAGSFRPVDVMAQEQMAPRGRLVFAVGVGALLFVPVFKSLTGLPPYLGMLAGLGTLWLLTDAIHYGESPERQRLKVPQALSRIDTQGVLFFLGILLSVASLESAGLLRELATWLSIHLPNIELVATLIGIASAIIDNVPLVAATMGMYDMKQFPMDNELWQLIAYCAGTGGSILIIGSAAGVAFMGMEKADFVWYLKRVSGYALAGYLAGIACYLATSHLGLIGDLPVLAQTTNALSLAAVPTDLVTTTAQAIDAVPSQAMLATITDAPAHLITAIGNSPVTNLFAEHWETGRATLEQGAGQVIDVVATTVLHVPHLFM